MTVTAQILNKLLGLLDEGSVASICIFSICSVSELIFSPDGWFPSNQARTADHLDNIFLGVSV